MKNRHTPTTQSGRAKTGLEIFQLSRGEPLQQAERVGKLKQLIGWQPSRLTEVRR